MYSNRGGDQTAPSKTGTSYAGMSNVNACMANAATAAPFNAANAALGYTDNCGGAVTATLTGTAVTGTNCSWTVTYTYSVKDVCGNTLAGRTYANTGGDKTAPVAKCRPVTVALVNGTATVTAAQVDNGSTDDCSGIASLTLSKTTFNCSNIGNNNVTLTVKDGCGNTSTCTAVVTVTGSTPSCT